MKKIVLALIALLLLTNTALAEKVEEILYTKTGAKIYSRADRESPVIGQLEAYMPYVFQTEEGFAYNAQVGGYVERSKMRAIIVKELQPKSIFFENERILYELPMDKSKVIRKLEIEEELILLGSSIGYAKVQDGLGNIGYVHSKSLIELGKSRRIRDPFNVYARFPASVLEKPIVSAKAVGYLEPYVVYTVSETSRGFVKVGLGEVEGYVEMDSLNIHRTKAEQILLAYSPHRFSVVDEDGTEREGSYIYVVQRSKGVIKEKATGNVLRAQDVEVTQINAIKRSLVKANGRVALYKNPQTTMEQDIHIEQDHFVAVEGETINSYLVNHQGVLGFVRKSECSEVELTELNPTFVEFLDSVSLRSINGEEYRYQKGDFSFVTAKYSDYYRLSGEAQLFVAADKLKLMGQDTPLDENKIKLVTASPFYRFPDTRSQSSMQEEGKAATILGFNGAMAKLMIDKEIGYVPLSAVDHYEFDPIPKEQKKYRLFVNKSTASLTVYEELPDGSLAANPVVETMVAIGRNTSPTPSGTFVLGKKERWHKWSASYSPFAIEFTPARYLHGLLYKQARSDSIMKYSETYFGQKATGGCLRSPDEVAKWIYYNCPSYSTTIEIKEE